MNEPKYIRIRVTPELREKVDDLKRYAVISDDAEAVRYAVEVCWFEEIGQFKC